ncbi:5-formyltetrahydrofolate cyclo-ligase [Cohnella cholangitidis]|uniref:5-formyltetrahydrofolate cyclo-ligase n=1 Tax=Cohnella cholangitidis TaxID=2598458 RepID=A0A7G5C226_9BACL|nr:5-formyltetrahydrofolate cyclo-ligase [Cohnella cholangitidis]QMV43260.1 5-formyltetrahydrofolate cyclo-ligase [Cohnella cholangitidis]
MKIDFHGVKKVGLPVMVEDQGIAEKKVQWRRRMTSVRDGLSAEERDMRSVKLCGIAENEVLSPIRKRLGRPLALCAYAPFRSEASPLPMLHACWEQGDQIFAPRIAHGGEGMELRKVEALTDWIPGKWGVPEPDPERTFLIEGTHPLDVVLVPGIAYHIEGGRLGYGGGYYDRLYAERRRTYRGETLWIGFAFGEQVVSEPLPIEPHDLRLQGLATDERMIWFR